MWRTPPSRRHDRAIPPRPRRRPVLGAWIDQQAGTVRARVFAARYGVPQDEACGSASMLLAAHLGRAVTIQHGRGSVVQASPAPNGMADLDGRVVWDHERAVD
jgi:predicted PhzF superfamily epimerase YddE/YHI9